MYINQHLKKPDAPNTAMLSNEGRASLHRFYSQKTRFVYPGLIGCLAVVLILIALQGPSISQTQLPGMWLSPTKGQVVHDIVHLAASTHVVTSDTFKVDHIIFTAWWAGVDPDHWVNLCSASAHDEHNVFQCDGNLRLLQAPVGNVTISFDIYDSHNRVRLAPDGGFTITYISGSVYSSKSDYAFRYKQAQHYLLIYIHLYNLLVMQLFTTFEAN